MPDHHPVCIDRRAFLQGSTLLLTAAGSSLAFADDSSFAFADDSSVDFRIGMITDLHYADKPLAGSRSYRETLGKLMKASDTFIGAKTDMIIELGDLIDATGDAEISWSYLKTVNDEFQKICGDRHYVLGNHCVDTLTKGQFLGAVSQEESYYSFDRGDWHFVVLDACFTRDQKPYHRKNFVWSDANVPAKELKWLADDLAANDKPTIVFVHQRLDNAGSHMVRNAANVRTILELSRNVHAVFQGHHHANSYQQIGGIHYCTLAAMVEGSGAENNAYALLDLLQDGSLRLSGFQQQANYKWRTKA
ncbi:metallophosphoesterase family protein [Blastopirellula marina]|uniref:Alkaline phosphatase phoA-like protein n=1 Tax=Blastopirellula marina DSM 3645 TaxID=314230 RepID=A3ZZ48_9BACT|nr:metallophosphoesterase family protein [Blastopirellula marina]EAQ78222.1 alkaline phosphatase phoA-like protein [Blastopirellula marina DSM 3645]